MTDNEFLLQDRIQKIRQVINKYGEENFYISFSGGKDSCVLSKLIDIAFPNNNIPRVYADTGIELNMIRDFVYKQAEDDWRIEILKPSKNIKQVLEENGYPFKSKTHSELVGRFQKRGMKWGEYFYVNSDSGGYAFRCPKKLKYQFTDECSLKISDVCCKELKELPVSEYQKRSGKLYNIVGIRRDEGGRRKNGKCMVFSGKSFKKFQPLVVVTEEWEQWFINEYNVEICDIYKEPYNFPRTGCKGCPFNAHLQHELDVLEKFFPNERKQCEYIWKPVYDEYRRIGYRLKG